MSRQIQIRRGTSAENDAFTGAIGEITMDTTNKTLRVHDGSTAGGTTLAKQSDIPQEFPFPFPDFSTEVIVSTSAGSTFTLPYNALLMVRSGGNSCVALKKDNSNGIDLFYHENINSNTTLSSMILPKGTTLYVLRYSGSYAQISYYKMV